MDKHIFGASKGVCLGVSVECRYVCILRVNVHKDLQVQCDRWMGGEWHAGNSSAALCKPAVIVCTCLATWSSLARLFSSQPL